MFTNHSNCDSEQITKQKVTSAFQNQMFPFLYEVVSYNLIVAYFNYSFNIIMPILPKFYSFSCQKH